MPRNGSGIYSAPAGTAAVTLTPIASAPYNGFITDIGNEITNSLPTTGVKAMAANLPMGGNKITNMADPTVSTDAATKNYADSVAPHRIVNIRLITTTGTITPTTSATLWDLYAMGGSGGSGGCAATSASQAAVTSSTASGAYAISVGVAAPTTSTFTIGAAGAAGTAGNNAGGNGGTTTVVGTGINISCPGSSGSPGSAAFTIAGATVVGTRNVSANSATGGNSINSQGFAPAFIVVLGGSISIGAPGLSQFGEGAVGSGAEGILVAPSGSAKAGNVGQTGYVWLVERS